MSTMKYRVYALYTSSVFVGEFEAESKEEASAMAEESPEFQDYIGLCHQCTNTAGGDGLQFSYMMAEEVAP